MEGSGVSALLRCCNGVKVTALVVLKASIQDG